MTAKPIKVKRWQCVCEKCGEVWQSRTEEKPNICPFCKTAHWEHGKPRRTKKEEEK